MLLCFYSQFNVLPLSVKTGQYNEAITIYKEVLQAQSQILGENHLDFIRTKLNFANCLDSKGKYM